VSGHEETGRRINEGERVVKRKEEKENRRREKRKMSDSERQNKNKGGETLKG
jgi:hypothetical protein